MMLIEQSPVCMAMLDNDLRYLVVNERWIHQYGRGYTDLIGRLHYDVHPDIPDEWKVVHRRALQGEVIKEDDDAWQLIDGTLQWLRWVVQPWYAESGQIGGIIISAEDVTARHHMAEELKIAASTFTSADAMLITDAAGVIQRVNDAYCQITGYSAEEAIGKKPGELVKSGKQDAAFYHSMWESLVATGIWRGELTNRRKNGELFPQFMSISAVKNDAGVISHYVGILRDISDQKSSEEQIRRLAYFDPLTTLPNRRMLTDRLQHLLHENARSGEYGALFFIDLDNFKNVNDTLGHQVGDRLLIETARRLRSCLRESDTVARLGGDEFVVLIEDLGGDAVHAATNAKISASKILDSLGKVYTLEGRECLCTPSIGITLFAGNAGNYDEILKQADLALYGAKAEGKNTLRFFDPALQYEIERRSMLERDLRRAIQCREFILHYQAQIDRDGTIVGFESLLRWQHPLQGLIRPDEFIPLAEESGLILALGRGALMEACQQLAVWADDPRSAALSLSVNVSVKQFRADDFVESVKTALQQTHADPRNLKLELTESLLLENVDAAIDKMHVLRELGVRFSLDDFGTGYSSLAYLKRLPLEQVKIDRSFVADIIANASDAVIARAIIALAHSLGLSVVAEGVETEAQWTFLLADGCDLGQGYLFSKPVKIDDAQRLLCS